MQALDRNKAEAICALPLAPEVIAWQHMESLPDKFLDLFVSTLYIYFTLESQYLQTNEFFYKFTSAINPHLEQTWILNKSDTLNKRYCKNLLIPWDKMQSLSISPKRRPPPLLLPWVGWRVIATTVPLDLAYILSSTMCLKRW